MRDQHMTTGLVMTWVPVRDAHGRVRMEARWMSPALATAAPRPHAA